MKPKYKLIIKSTGLESSNRLNENLAIDLAEKIFDLVLTSPSIAHGARAFELALHGLNKFPDFMPVFEASSRASLLGIKGGQQTVEVVEVGLA